jgi:hypothetical protein
MDGGQCKQSEATPSKAKQSQAKPSKAKQSKANTSKAKQSQAKPSKAKFQFKIQFKFRVEHNRISASYNITTWRVVSLHGAAAAGWMPHYSVH